VIFLVFSNISTWFSMGLFVLYSLPIEIDIARSEIFSGLLFNYTFVIVFLGLVVVHLLRHQHRQ